MGRKINYADHLEQKIGEALFEAEIGFTHGSESKGQRLDFHLTDDDIYIEVKQYHSERIADQLKVADNIVVVQGRKSVDFMAAMIKSIKFVKI